MKHFPFLTTIVLICIGASAQMQGNGRPGHAMPDLGHVYGKLKDSAIMVKI